MRNLMKRAQMKMINLAVKAKVVLQDQRGEGFVDSAVKILISVVIGHYYLQVFMHYSDLWSCPILNNA